MYNIYIYIYIYIQISGHKIAKYVSIEGKLKVHFFLQILRCLYEIFYSSKSSTSISINGTHLNLILS